MADFYDMNAAIQKPNIVNALRQGQQYGMQLKQQQQQVADQNALRDLAPKIISGDQTAFAQGAAINPEAAGQYQQAGDGQLRRLKGAIDYFDKGLQSGDERLIQARYREIAPFLSSLTGNPAPEAYTPDMLPAFEQVKTKIALAGNSTTGGVIQSQKISDDGFIINTYRDGRIEKTDQKVDRQAWFRDNPGQDPVIVGKDGTSTMVGAPQGMSPQPQAPQPDGTPAPEGQQITPFAPDVNIPQSSAEYAAFQAASEDANSPNPTGQSFKVGEVPYEAFQAPPGANSFGAQARQPAPAARPFVSQTLPRRPSAGEEAAAVARAKADVELSMAPMIAGATEGAKLDANLSRADQLAAADANRQRQIDEAKAQAEKNAARPGLNAAYDLWTVASDELANALNSTRTGPIVGRMAALSADAQNADSAVAAMAPVLKGLFRQAGEGTFTKDDQAVLMAMLPTREMLPEARKDALRRVNDMVRAKLQIADNPGSGGYSVGQVIETNGKRYRVTGGDPADPDVEEIR